MHCTNPLTAILILENGMVNATARYQSVFSYCAPHLTSLHPLNLPHFTCSSTSASTMLPDFWELTIVAHSAQNTQIILFLQMLFAHNNILQWVL